MNMKNKMMMMMVMGVLALAQCAFAGLQLETAKKETVSNNVPIMVGAKFNEEDPLFTNWVYSAEFSNIPRITSEVYETEYDNGGEPAVFKGRRTTFFIGGFDGEGKVVKTDNVLDMYDTYTNVVVATPGSTATVYKCWFVDLVFSNKADRVSLDSINTLPPGATDEQIVNAVKALATALGRTE